MNVLRQKKTRTQTSVITLMEYVSSAGNCGAASRKARLRSRRLPSYRRRPRQQLHPRSCALVTQSGFLRADIISDSRHDFSAFGNNETSQTVTLQQAGHMLPGMRHMSMSMCIVHVESENVRHDNPESASPTFNTECRVRSARSQRQRRRTASGTRSRRLAKAPECGRVHQHCPPAQACDAVRIPT